MPEKKSVSHEQRMEDINAKIERDKASVKKKLAKQAFAAGILFTAAGMGISAFVPGAAERLDHVSEIILAGIFSCFSIAGTYVGLATWVNRDMTSKR